MSLRLLTHSDLPALMRLKDAAGWNQTEQDVLRILELAPQGCYGIEVEGVLAATTSAICYGRELAWIGMVLTLPEFRRRGLALTLVERAMRDLARLGVQCIKLDATEMGRPLYERVGFTTECAIERWMRPPEPDALQTEAGGTGAPVNIDVDLDRRAFGADRTLLLRHLAAIEGASLEGAGYALSRPGSRAVYFGPCVALSAESARALVETQLLRHPHEAIYWDLLPANQETVRLAREYGFSPVRALHRMVQGAGRVDWDVSRTYAIAGFEFG